MGNDKSAPVVQLGELKIRGCGMMCGQEKCTKRCFGGESPTRSDVVEVPISAMGVGHKNEQHKPADNKD
jgi:hypothetical protein